MSVAFRPEGTVSFHPDGGPGVDFSHSLRFVAEGKGLNVMLGLEYSALDYRVTAGESLAELPGYSGRAGVYFRANPPRMILLGSVAVGIAAIAWELLAPVAVLAPQFLQSLSGAH